MMTYKIESGKLAIYSGSNLDDPIIKEFDGAPVYKILPLSSGERCLVLLDPGFSKAPTFENLLCLDHLGCVVWKAQLPQSHDAFVDVLLNEGTIEGRSWNGFRVVIDPITGKSREMGFEK